MASYCKFFQTMEMSRCCQRRERREKSIDPSCVDLLISESRVINNADSIASRVCFKNISLSWAAAT